MKIAVINFSGNVGKSTLAQHWLLPRLTNAAIIAVETINADDNVPGLRFKGREFSTIQKALLQHTGDVIVDVGSSNVEEFMTLMKQYHGSVDDFDAFIVPTIPEVKQQQDTLSTLGALQSVGVPLDRVHLVFNRVPFDDDAETRFPDLFLLQHDDTAPVINPAAVIHDNELFGLLKASDDTIADLLADQTDFKAQIVASRDADEKNRLVDRLAMRRLALGVNEELDQVFEILFGETVHHAQAG